MYITLHLRWSLFKLYVLFFLLQVPLSHWLWWYFIHTQASKKITLCLQRLWHVYLFLSNRFLSEWIKEGGFLFWYFIQPCVSVRGWGWGSGRWCHLRVILEKFMAFEFRRPEFRSQLGHTPGSVSPGQSLWQFSLYFFHPRIKDKKSVSFVNPLWNETALA